MRDVQALILAPEAGDANPIGASFLKRRISVEQRDGLLILRQETPLENRRKPGGGHNKNLILSLSKDGPVGGGVRARWSVLRHPRIKSRVRTRGEGVGSAIKRTVASTSAFQSLYRANRTYGADPARRGQVSTSDFLLFCLR